MPAAAQFPIERLAKGGYVVMLRHALAPRVGDPANYGWTTAPPRENLSEDGWAQARRLGERLRARGIDQAEVYSSQWCRCLETAELLEPGPVAELPAPPAEAGFPMTPELEAAPRRRRSSDSARPHHSRIKRGRLPSLETSLAVAQPGAIAHEPQYDENLRVRLFHVGWADRLAADGRTVEGRSRPRK